VVSRRPRPPDAGLTLVELLITIVVASLVAGSTFVFFAGQQRIYDTQTKVLNIQQNLWAAMETLTRFVRAAGTGMDECVRPDSDGAGADTGDPGPGASGTTPPQTGLRAFRSGGGGVQRIPPLWIRNGANGAPDRIRVAFGNGTFGGFMDSYLATPIPADTPTAPIVLAAGHTASYRTDEFIVLLDTAQTPASGNLDRVCMLAQITGIVSAGNLLDHASTSPWNPASNQVGLVPWTLGGGASGPGAVRHFGQLNWIEFSIDAAGPAPRLMMERLETNEGPQVLAEGVEDLQVAYACDGAGGNARNGVLTEGAPGARTNDEWVYNAAGDVELAGCGRPSAVRLTLITRSIAPDDTLEDVPNNFKPAVEDGAAGAKDNFRHRVLTTTVYPRN
jgi:prepilin-type N-terminal cleavage/methylation domain-containing protein